MDTIRKAILDVLAQDRPITVRQVFYRLTSRGAIDKTEEEYKGTVVRLLVEMRRTGEIPFGWIADNTRWMRKPSTFNGLESALSRTAETYRRAVWDAQDAYVEIWLEKDALAGVLLDVTAPWDVPLMVTRGFPSLSYLHEAATSIRHMDKPAFLYYFGDHDPSGVDITRVVEKGIREFAPGADITFERVAMTPTQIVELSLPTRPTKGTDSRSKGFEGESVEVDAIEPASLREMVEACIARHIDHEEHERLLEIEEAERATLREIARKAVR
jgi:hypothetical protein